MLAEGKHCAYVCPWRHMEECFMTVFSFSKKCGWGIHLSRISHITWVSGTWCGQEPSNIVMGIIFQTGRYPCFAKFVTGLYGFYWSRNPSILSTPNELATKNSGCVLVKRVISYMACKIRISAMLHGNVYSVIFEIFMLLVLKLSNTSYHLLYNNGLNVIRQHIKASPPATATMDERTLHLIRTIPVH
jgi:hypothetical protein